MLFFLLLALLAVAMLISYSCCSGAPGTSLYVKGAESRNIDWKRGDDEDHDIKTIHTHHAHSHSTRDQSITHLLESS